MNWTRFYFTITAAALTSSTLYITLSPETFWQRIIAFCFSVVVSVGLGLCIIALYERLYKMENIRNINKAGWTPKKKETE